MSFRCYTSAISLLRRMCGSHTRDISVTRRRPLHAFAMLSCSFWKRRNLLPSQLASNLPLKEIGGPHSKRALLRVPRHLISPHQLLAFKPHPLIAMVWCFSQLNNWQGDHEWAPEALSKL